MTAGDGDGSSHRSRKRPLSEEDRRLWEHVVRSVSPGVRGKSRIADRTASLEPPPPGESTTELHRRLESSGAGGAERPRQAPPKAMPKPPPPPPRQHAPPPIADFDRKAVRRIRSGRIEIEARIDLHGMRQDEAHVTLRSFLNGSYARHLRWVLVITGKGRAARFDDEGEAGRGTPNGRRDDRRPLPSWHDDERGVLKRMVPRWLGEPDLRAIVVSYTTAAPNHGGDGALYIQLRARR